MVFKIDSLKEASIFKKLKTSRLNKEEHQLENSVVNVGAGAKLKLIAATFCLRRKGSYEAIARQLFWIVSSSLQKSAHWFTDWFVVCVALICSIWFATMQNPLNFSKRLPIMFLLCIKSKQLFDTSQNHKWMSFWRWLDLIRRRSLRTLIFAKIVWMYFLVITCRSTMRNYGRFLRLYVCFHMGKVSQKGSSQSSKRWLTTTWKRNR